MSMELLFIDTGFQDRKSDLQDSKSNWTSLFRIVPASDAYGRNFSGPAAAQLTSEKLLLHAHMEI